MQYHVAIIQTDMMAESPAFSCHVGTVGAARRRGLGDRSTVGLGEVIDVNSPAVSYMPPLQCVKLTL